MQRSRIGLIYSFFTEHIAAGILRMETDDVRIERIDLARSMPAQSLVIVRNWD